MTRQSTCHLYDILSFFRRNFDSSEINIFWTVWTILTVAKILFFPHFQIFFVFQKEWRNLCFFFFWIFFWESLYFLLLLLISSQQFYLPQLKSESFLLLKISIFYSESNNQSTNRFYTRKKQKQKVFQLHLEISINFLFCKLATPVNTQCNQSNERNQSINATLK